MTSSSAKPLPTLKGIFSVPKTNHRRDFLRENKLSLKELEKTTTKKLAQEPMQPKWMRNTRAKSQLRMESPSDQKSEQKSKAVRCQSCGSTGSIDRTPSMTSCNKEIQTDDINDEYFLYEALKKCSSSDQIKLEKPHINDNHSELKTSQPDDIEYQALRRIASNSKIANTKQSGPIGYGEEHSICGRSHISNGSVCDQDHDELPKRFHNLVLEEDEIEQPLSGRSHQTMRSNVSTKSKKQLHQLGSRDDLRLPRYMEREKREREEELQREQGRDLDCPEGHVVLSEHDRLAALKGADKKFKDLINELNQMPMTSQTLRTRTRKAEIEKELCDIENDLRLYGKTKVYIRRE